MNLIIFLIGIVLISNVNSTKLNYPRVLLPIFDKFSVNFTLDVIEKGCYKWTSSRNDLIQISTEYEDDADRCSSRVIVSVITKEKHRNTAIVLAENLSSGEVIRCDVILDVIDQLAVLTTTRELYLEEAPETFELIAQDSQGNAFTTLEGIEFNWKISTQNNYQNDENWTQVLRFLKFSESKYHETPKTVEQIEIAGLKGYMVLLEGINTGSAKVTVRLPYNEYNHVPPIEVDIMILANIILDPTEAAILVGDTIDFRVLQLKQGKLQEIALNSQYFLEIENVNFAKIDGRTATGLKLGKTVVTLRDRNVPSDKSTDAINSLSPRSTLIVANAAKIGLSLLPYNNWVTVEEERHEIAVDLYTRDDQKITLGSKYRLDSTFEKEKFFELSRTKNGSRIFGEAIVAGKNPVTGSYEKLHAENEMLIYKKLTLHPTRVILPFDPNFPTHHQIHFKASGGDGHYVWSSANTQLLSISQSGVAETRLDALRKTATSNQQNLDNSVANENLVKLTNIKVALAKNNFISRSAEILFLTPVKLEIVQYNFETPLKDYVKVHVALYALHNETLLPFTLCDNVNFDLDFSSQIFVEDTTRASTDEQLAENACRVYHLKSTNLGTTNLKISYKYNNKLLKDEVNLVVFERLVIFNPVENEIVLPIGSSRNVIYKNGPSKVYTIDSELTKALSYDRGLIGVNEYQPNDGGSLSKEKHVYTILCRKVGETVFKFDIYNILPSVRNNVPFVSTYETRVHCVKPRYINLYTSAKIKDGCPMERRKSLMHVNNLENDVEIDIEVLDDSKRVLSNVTSLVMDWKFFAGDKLKSNALDYRRAVNDDWLEGVPIPRRTFLKTTLPDVNMNFKIKGMVIEYDAAVLSRESIKPESPQFGIRKTASGSLVTPIIENELNFYAVDNTLLPFDSISIYLTKRRSERVRISQGSGFYELAASEPGIVQIEFDSNTRELVLTPIRVGDVRIDILDRCLMTEPAHLYVSVVSIERIAIEMADRVEKTKSIEAIVKLYDANDRLIRLETESLDIYELSEEVLNPNLINARLGSQENLGVGEIRYIVTGVELGETKIIVNSGRVNTISSNAAPVQVFPPLRLYPRNSTIYVGASVQVYSVGGPSPDVNIVYTVQFEDIAKMDSSIVTGAKIGETIVTGKCVGVNPATGQQIVFSEDFVSIRVIPLDKIKIKVPLVRVRVGSTMPAAIWGVPDISPVILGTLNPLRVHWTTNQPGVIEIGGVFADAGIEYGEEDSISIRVTGLNPGKVLLNAVVVTPNGVRLKSSVEVSVFKMLELESPKKIYSDAILIAPKSEIQLKSNLDDTVYEMESSDSMNVIRVTRGGYVTASETIGRGLIIATSADQTLPIPIEVKNVHYILATLHPSNLKLNSVERKIPLGFNLLLRVTLHDNLGNEFSHNLDDVNLLKFDVARKEMIDINVGQNFTVNLNLLRETSNMIAISLKDSSGIKYSEDYLKLAVGPSQFVYPTKTIFSVGDIICFGSHVDTSSKWFSADESIVSVNGESGVGQVVANRIKHGDKVSVYQGQKSTGSLKFDLEIREADKIEFFKEYDTINGNLYHAFLVIRNHQQTDKQTNLFGKNLTICSSKLDTVKTNFFTCKLITRQSSSNVYLQHFRVVQIFDKHIGQYGCEVAMKTSLNEFNALIQNKEVHLELEARLQNGVTASLPLKVVPGISVTPRIINADQIMTQGITVSGLEKTLQRVTVLSSDSSAIVVSEIKRSPEMTVYKFKPLKQISDDDRISIRIASPLTDQSIEVLVQSSESTLKCSQRSFVGVSSTSELISKFGLIISSVIVLLFSIVILIFCFQKSQPVDNQIFLSPSKAKKNVSMNASGNELSFPHSPVGASSPYNLSGGSIQPQTKNPEMSPIYGDTTFASPDRRLHRRFL